jgi:hypothetical protein
VEDDNNKDQERYLQEMQAVQFLTMEQTKALDQLKETKLALDVLNGAATHQI